MFPLRDSTPSTQFPYITILLIIINLVIFTLEAGLDPETLNAIINVFGLVPKTIHQYHGLAVYIPFVSSMFLHGSWTHVIGNMWILWLFGDNVEDCMGHAKFLFFYFICGIIAAMAHYFTDPQSVVPVVGASGAIAGVMGAYFLMFKNARVLTYIFPIFLITVPAWFFLGVWAVTQLWSGAAVLMHTTASSTGQIAFWAHIGGFAAGMILYRYFLTPAACQKLGLNR